MNIEIINPTIPKEAAQIIEYCMMIQNVDKIEDLKWIILSETMTKKELEKIYPKK